MASNNSGEDEDGHTDEMEPMDFSFHEHEEDLALSCSNATDTKFDIAIGHIEDIIMEDEFQATQNEFLEKYYQEFDDSEENKFIYTDIHREYVNLIEKYLETELSKRIPEFSMAEFTKLVLERKNELEGEIFDMLLTFSDFMAFKEMFLDYKAEKEGRSVDLSAGITVTSMQEDMPDFSIGNTFSLTGHTFGNPNGQNS